MNIKRLGRTGPLILLLALLAVFSAGAAEKGEQGKEGISSHDGIAMEVTYGYDNTAKGGPARLVGAVCSVCFL